MEFFTGNPQSVRGLGNILLDKKELDMLEYYSQVTQTEDIVNETSMKVFSMSYLDDSEDDIALPYDVNSFLLGAVASVSLANNKLDVNRYESNDLEVVTLRQLKHALSGKVKYITFENNVLRVVTFERSDLTGLQTKAAIVTLLTNVVSDVSIVGNGLVVERWSAADVENGITELEWEPHISVSATNPYMLSGETTDLVVSLITEFGSPVSGKNVTIEQSIFSDNGTTSSHNDSWRVTNGTMTRMDSYTRLVESAQTLMCQMDSAYINPTSIVEFDFKAVDGVKNGGLIYIRNSGGGNSLANLSLNNVGGEIGEWIHLKIVFNNTDTITIYSSKLDNPITRTLSSTDTNYRLLLYCGGTNTELHFKNVIVYETINGVTDEKGEFALNDVSVSQDTTFTATYSSATDSCLVEYCVFVDKGTTASHNSHWYINSYGTATVQDDGTKLLNTSGDINFVMRSIIPSNKTITEANSYSYNPPYIVEFDIVETDGTPNNDAQVQIYSQQTTNNFAQGLTTGHYKIKVTSEEQKIWVDDTLIKTTNLSLPNARITLCVRQGKYLIYKNFRIREG